MAAATATKRQTGFNGSLTAQQRKALVALKEALLAFSLDHTGDADEDEGEESSPAASSPAGPIAPGSKLEEAAEAELLADSRRGLLRFLRARDFDVIKARDMAIASCCWRASVRPWSIEPTSIPEALPSGAWRFGGHTKAGMPILLFDCAAWAPWQYRFGMDEFTRYIAYLMEGALGRMGPGVEQVCMIWSVQGWTQDLMKPLAVRCMSQLLHILQAMYPERVGLTFLCGVNQLFQGYFFRILRPWMSHRFLTTFKFVSDAKQLHEHIDRSQLPDRVGATQVCGTHEEFPIPLHSVADELDIFIADLGGPDNLPVAAGRDSAVLAPQQTSISGAVSGTHVGEVDLLQGKPCYIELALESSTAGIAWHVAGPLLGVAFGYKVCQAGMFGERILEEGSGGSASEAGTPAAATPTPGRAGAIEGSLVVKEAWAGCKLRLMLYSSYSRENCRTLQYCIGVEAR